VPNYQRQESAVRPGEQPDLRQLMKQAQKIQQQMADAHADLAETELTGTSDDGLVTVTIIGTAEVTAVKIDPKAVDPDDVERLEDLVLAAIRNATQALRELTRQRLGPLTASIEGMASDAGPAGF
jgi:DNA-binding YbaB/EbfC family protein